MSGLPRTTQTSSVAFQTRQRPVIWGIINGDVVSQGFRERACTAMVVYDSRIDTWQHIHEVRRLLSRCIKQLLDRQDQHDLSKLESPEREASDWLNPRLAGLAYGSDEYNSCLAEMRPVLEQHARANRHHPEASGGIGGMNLIDLLEMLCDWKAASLRHDSDVRRSIEINQKRFGFSDELKKILVNTLAEIDPPVASK